MELILYKVLDNANVLNKNLTNGLAIDIKLKSYFDISNPEIPLANVTGLGIDKYNYIHIPELERYYFVNKFTNLNSKIISLQCEIDLLMTYRNDILNSKARLRRKIRNGDFYNGNLDSSVKTSLLNYKSDVILEDEANYILTTVGGS